MCKTWGRIWIVIKREKSDPDPHQYDADSVYAVSTTQYYKCTTTYYLSSLQK